MSDLLDPKFCTKCQIYKEGDQFAPSIKSRGWCNPCQAEARRARRRDPVANAAINARRRERVAIDPHYRMRKSDAHARWRAKPGSKEYVRAKNVWAAHGITLEEYDEWMSGPCGICGALAECLDHDHDTGRIRGPLCQHCNIMLGQSRDDPDRLRAGAAYLERFRLRLIEGGG